MSKKQNQKSTQSKKSNHPSTTTSHQLVSAKRTSVAAATSASAGAAGNKADPRLPQIGTVVRKLDRDGTLRCKCRIVQQGVRYGGNLYRSLSAAALAAASDLGLESPTQNGFVFWGLND